ncbi:MAG: IclR family transcriptional regulator C-terminal domain-containing protein [Lentisphaerota bacterium]
MIQVLERFNLILEYVAENHTRPCRIKELAALLQVSQPACSNIVRSMVQLGYLESATDANGYVIGPKPSMLVRNGGYKQFLTKIAEPLINALVGRINEMCLLVTDSNFKRILLLQKQGERPVQVSSDIRASENLFQTATGIVILAHLPENEIKSFAEKNPVSKTIFPAISNWENLIPKLNKIRKDRYLLILHEEEDKDAFGSIAVPVYNGKRLEAVLGCKFPTYRFKGEQRNLIIQECIKTAAVISAGLERPGHY